MTKLNITWRSGKKASEAWAKLTSQRGWEVESGTCGFVNRHYAEGSVELEFKPWRDTWRLAFIRTSGAGRGKGLASRVLKEIAAAADQAGITLTLGVEPQGNGLDYDQLENWYGRHGFSTTRSNQMERKPLAPEADRPAMEGLDPLSSPAFRRWFGNSKVVDADGRPLRCYHGTGADIPEFSYEFTDMGNDQIGSGFYFTTSPDTASGYASSRLTSDTPKPGGENPNVMPVYLSIQKPLDSETKRGMTAASVKAIILKAPELDQQLENFGDVAWEGIPKVMARAVQGYAGMPIMKALNTLANDFYPGHVEAFNEAVRAVTGYDGVYLKYDNETHWVAWFPWQIKSATGNRGTWSTGSRGVVEGGAQDIVEAKREAASLPTVIPGVVYHGTAQDIVEALIGAPSGNYRHHDGQENIVAAAVKVRANDDVFLGDHHGDAMDLAYQNGYKSPVGRAFRYAYMPDPQFVEGFWTDRGRFLDRKEALELARRNKATDYWDRPVNLTGVPELDSGAFV